MPTIQEVLRALLGGKRGDIELNDMPPLPDAPERRMKPPARPTVKMIEREPDTFSSPDYVSVPSMSKDEYAEWYKGGDEVERARVRNSPKGSIAPAGARSIPPQRRDRSRRQ